MLTADNLIPRRVAQTPIGRVVTFWTPEDLERDDSIEANETPTERITRTMRESPEREFSGQSFGEIDQKTACKVLARLEAKGFIFRSSRRVTGEAGGRPCNFFKWGAQ